MIGFLNRKYSDEKFLEGIKSRHPKWEDRVYAHLNEKTKGFCRKHYGAKNSYYEEAFEDAFGNAFITMVNNVRKEGFQLTSTLNTYFTSIFKFKYIDELRKLKKKYTFADESELIQHKSKEKNKLEILILKEEVKKVTEILVKGGKNCKEIITLSLTDGLPYKEIAKLLNLKNADVVKKRKYHCMKKISMELELMNVGL